tara:strand:+ start:257 stop:517 length:261 start_codon:yes stop_codon:yes gene_type:complete
MIIKIFKLINIIIIILFFTFITNYYFSDQNINLIKKNRNIYILNKHKINLELPTLKNDTSDVIEFNSGYETSNTKKFKRNFWELFK